MIQHSLSKIIIIALFNILYLLGSYFLISHLSVVAPNLFAIGEFGFVFVVLTLLSILLVASYNLCINNVEKDNNYLKVLGSAFSNSFVTKTLLTLCVFYLYTIFGFLIHKIFNISLFNALAIAYSFSLLTIAYIGTGSSLCESLHAPITKLGTQKIFGFILLVTYTILLIALPISLVLYKFELKYILSEVIFLAIAFGSLFTIYYFISLAFVTKCAVLEVETPLDAEATVDNFQTVETPEIQQVNSEPASLAAVDEELKVASQIQLPAEDAILAGVEKVVLEELIEESISPEKVDSKKKTAVSNASVILEPHLETASEAENLVVAEVVPELSEVVNEVTTADITPVKTNNEDLVPLAASENELNEVAKIIEPTATGEAQAALKVKKPAVRKPRVKKLNSTAKASEDINATDTSEEALKPRKRTVKPKLASADTEPKELNNQLKKKALEENQLDKAGVEAVTPKKVVRKRTPKQAVPETNVETAKGKSGLNSAENSAPEKKKVVRKRTPKVLPAGDLKDSDVQTSDSKVRKPVLKYIGLNAENLALDPLAKAPRKKRTVKPKESKPKESQSKVTPEEVQSKAHKDDVLER